MWLLGHSQNHSRGLGGSRDTFHVSERVKKGLFGLSLQIAFLQIRKAVWLAHSKGEKRGKLLPELKISWLSK